MQDATTLGESTRKAIGNITSTILLEDFPDNPPWLLYTINNVSDSYACVRVVVDSNLYFGSSTVKANRNLIITLC